jgi:hypothetical protein
MKQELKKTSTRPRELIAAPLYFSKGYPQLIVDFQAPLLVDRRESSFLKKTFLMIFQLLGF